MPKGGRRPGAGRPKGCKTKNRTPNPVREAITELAREHTPSAVTTLAEIMRDAGAPSAARVQAASTLLDRGHGRAPQTLEHKGDAGYLAWLDGVMGASRGLPGEQAKANGNGRAVH